LDLKKNEEKIRKNSLSTKDRFHGPAVFLLSRAAGYVKQSDQKKILHHFPKAQIIWMNGVGHNIHIDAPAQFLEKITQNQ